MKVDFPAPFGPLLYPLVFHLYVECLHLLLLPDQLFTVVVIASEVLRLEGIFADFVKFELGTVDVFSDALLAVGGVE